MARDGHSLIIISHKLHEVINISHRITVLRGGQLAGATPNDGVTRTQLARMMVGREVLLERDRSAVAKGETLLALRNVSALGITGQPALRDVSLQIQSGEILGVAGVSGYGERDLAEVIVGLRPVTQGSVSLGQDAMTHWPTGKRTAAGLAYIPEERMHDGVIQEFTVAETLILQDHTRPPFSNHTFLNFKAIGERSRQLVRDFQVKTPTIETKIKSLSGGNIQKVIMARELARQPRVLVAAQPTRGVDIGATEYIHQRLLDQRAQGTATLLISEDLDEIFALCDRIAVLYEGRIMGIVDRAQATAEQLGLLMAGVVG
jgi:simple sugar transport system ATP-binding protein